MRTGFIVSEIYERKSEKQKKIDRPRKGKKEIE
jgi:hypothetical protein